MDIELLKLALSKASTLDEARQFLEDFGLGKRQDIKKAELALSYGASTEQEQPAKPAPGPSTDERGRVRLYVKSSTMDKSLKRACTRWDAHEVARLKRSLFQHATTGSCRFELVSLELGRSVQAVQAMASLLLHHENNWSCTGLTPHTLKVLNEAARLPEYPQTPLPDFRMRRGLKEA